MGKNRFFELTKTDRLEVSKTIRGGGSGRLMSRCIVLKMKDNNYTNIEAAEIAGVTPRTVINICEYYTEYGLESALYDDPRSGRPMIYDDRVKSHIVATVCSDPPEGFDRWTLELLKSKVEDEGLARSISTETIRLILKEHDLKPWHQKMWCIPNLTDEYIERMEDILDIYERGDSIDFPLVCLDEKSVVLSEDSCPEILMEPGSPKKVDYEYKRRGTANVFFAVEPFGGKYIAKVTSNRKGVIFAHFLKSLSSHYKSSPKITLIMDNLNIHSKSSLVKAFGEAEADRLWDRFDVHYTPKHGSWLNSAEIGIGMYSRQCLGHTRIPDINTLRRKTASWARHINKKGVTINWSFTKTDARIKMNYKK